MAPGTEFPSVVCFLLCLTLPTPFISRLTACLSGTSFSSYPFLSLCSLLAVSQVPQGVASPLSHAAEESTGLAASGARGACRELGWRLQETGCLHSATRLCVTADLIFPFCKMGAQTATGTTDLSPATGPTKGTLGGRTELGPLLGVSALRTGAWLPSLWPVPGTQHALHNYLLNGPWLGLLQGPDMEALDPLKRLRLWTQPT